MPHPSSASTTSDTAILAVNLLVDMIERGKPFAMPPEYAEIADRTVSFVNAAQQAGYRVLFIQDQHRPDDKEFTDFSVGMPHAVRDTDGSQLIAGLRPRAGQDYTVGKRRFSAFFGTDLDLYLREEGIRRLVLVGRPSNVCALYSAADGWMRRYELAALSDCLYSKTGAMHDRAMREFAATIGTVLTSAEFLAGALSPLPALPPRLAVLLVNVNRDLVENNRPEDGTRLARRLPAIRALLDTARHWGLPVLYAMDAHLPNDWEFRLRRPHGIAGTPGADVPAEIAPRPGDAVLAKRCYDAFYETGLDPLLREQGVSRLVLAGGPTNVDLRYTAVSAYNLRYRPIVVKDCTDACSAEYAEETLQDMFFTRRMSLAQFQEWLAKQVEGGPHG